MIISRKKFGSPTLFKSYKYISERSLSGFVHNIAIKGNDVTKQRLTLGINMYIMLLGRKQYTSLIFSIKNITLFTDMGHLMTIEIVICKIVEITTDLKVHFVAYKIVINNGVV